MEPDILDLIFQKFFAEVKRKDGKDYEPCSLASLQAGLDRYLKEHGYKHSILLDRSFLSSKSVLEGKARILREQGKGKKPNKSCSLLPQEEKIL